MNNADKLVQDVIDLLEVAKTGLTIMYKNEIDRLNKTIAEGKELLKDA